MDASSRSNMTGTGESIMATDMMLPDEGLFTEPTIIGMSAGTGQTSHAANGTATSSAKGRTSGSASAIGSTHANASHGNPFPGRMLCDSRVGLRILRL